MATITPLRYPGAKNKLLPILMPYIDKIMENNNSFIDVFVGGGSVLLAVAQKYPRINLYANDKDYWMYCFWKVVSSPNIDELLELMKQKPTVELFNSLRNDKSIDETICAYKAIFFNRTTFSGILTSGPIGGQKQKSAYKIDCRYKFDKLKNKILKCNKLLIGRAQITNWDYSNYSMLTHGNSPVYLDPPYFVKGDMLYREQMDNNDHVNLFSILENRKNWVLSYDDCDNIRKLYNNKKVSDIPVEYCINGKKKQWKSKNELIITP